MKNVITTLGNYKIGDTLFLNRQKYKIVSLATVEDYHQLHPDTNSSKWGNYFWAETI